MENSAIMSAQQPTQQPSRPEGHRVTGSTASDGSVIEPFLQQVVNERNLLRSQNDQLWKIIEKQKVVINNLQKDNQRITIERDRLLATLNSSRSEDDMSPIERRGSDSKASVESGGNLNNSINFSDNNYSTEQGQKYNMDNNNSLRDLMNSPQSAHQLPPPPNSNQSKQLLPQMFVSDKEPYSHSPLDPKPQSQRQDSTNSALSDVSTNSGASVSGLLKAYNETDMQIDDQSKSEINSAVNENGIVTHFNNSFSSRSSNNSHVHVPMSPIISNLVKPPSSPPVLPPKSTQRQHSLKNDKRSSFLPNPSETQHYPLNYVEQNFESFTSQNLPSPTYSIKSSDSGSMSSSVAPSSHNSTIQIAEDGADALNQFPQPPKEHKSPEPPRSPGLPPSPRAFMHPLRSHSPSLDTESSEPNIVQPVRSQSLPVHDNVQAHPSISISGNNFGEDQTKSKRDSLTHNHSDSNLGGTYLAPKEKPLRSSKSFTHASPGQRARVSAMPPPRGGQYPEFPGQNSNTLFIPGQNNRHSVFMTSRDNPAAERVTQHRKNKHSLPDANIIADSSYGQYQQQLQPQLPQPPQIPQQPLQQPPQIQTITQQQQLQQQQQLPQESQIFDAKVITSDVIAGITVKVIGSNKKINDKGKEVLAFVISVGQARVHDNTIVGMERELWRVEKLYSDFLTLDSKLKQRQNKSTVNKIGKLPDKNLFYNNAPSKVDQRKIALEQYLQHIISLPLKYSKDLCEFLSTDMIDEEEKDYQQSGYKEGHLTKKGKNFGGWKTRYFVLNSPILEYYESKGGSHLGSIRLTHAQIGRQQNNANNDTDKDSENSYRHAFLIMEPKSNSKNSHTKHVLCAESDAERDEWVESLLQYVGVEEVQETKKHSKKKFSKDSIAKVNAQPISQLDKNDLSNKLTSTDSITQKDGRSDRKKGNNESISSIGVVKGDSVSYSSHHPSHHPSSSLSSSPSSQSAISLSLQSEHDQSRSSYGSNQQQSTLGVSSNPILKRSSILANREDRSGTPEPRDSAASPVFGMSVNNPSQQTSHVQRRPHDDNLHEKRKASRKTFFGNMFGSKDEKKKYQEVRPDASRIVFGVPLDQAIMTARIKEGYELPAVVYRCIEYLDAKNATEEEGIYRLSGATATIKFLKDRYNAEGDVDLLGEGEYYDVHAVAGLLKLYLRELPTSVLTRELHPEFVNVIDLLDRRDRVNELGRLVSSLPLSNYTLLRTLTGHLIRIVQNSHINKMTVRNIGIVFSPTLGIPAGVFSLFMAEFDYIFYTDSNGTAAPRSIDQTSDKSENNEKERSSSESENNTPINASHDTSKLGPDEVPLSPNALSPIAALRHRDIREDINGRSNRNSMHYMDGAPESVVGLERKLTVSKTLNRDDSSDEEEVNDLALQADDDDAETLSSASADEPTPSPPSSLIRTAVSAPVSPRLPVQNGFPRSNPSSGPHAEYIENTVPEVESLEMHKARRLTVRNFTERDSMYEVFSEHQRMIDVLNLQDEKMNQPNIQNSN